MHEEFMQRALILAEIASDNNEVPVGAIIVDENDNIIGEGYNQNIKNNDPCAHAEIIAIKNAANFKKNYRLPGCKIYVTLEPCMMCLGAIIHARLESVFFAASDLKTGCLGGKINLNNSDFGWNHKVKITSGILSEIASLKLSKFFKELRFSKKSKLKILDNYY